MTHLGLWIDLKRGLIAGLAGLALLTPAAAQNLPSVTAPRELAPYAAKSADGPERLTEFALSNATFILRHEIGHLLINEFELPVLGREEDAADILATLWLLGDDTDDSRQVLADAIDGWYLSGGGLTKAVFKAADFYDVHALDVQRAYNILCLGLGQNRMAFFRVAEQMGMRAQRRATCRFDFRTADRSWERLLAPHLREDDAPQQTIRIVYSEPRPAEAKIAAAMQEARLLEQAAEHITKTYALPRPLTFHAKACHDENAYFNAQTGTILFCYEVASYFGGLLGQQDALEAAVTSPGAPTQAMRPVGTSEETAR